MHYCAGAVAKSSVEYTFPFDARECNLNRSPPPTKPKMGHHPTHHLLSQRRLYAIWQLFPITGQGFWITTTFCQFHILLNKYKRTGVSMHLITRTVRYGTLLWNQVNINLNSRLWFFVNIMRGIKSVSICQVIGASRSVAAGTRFSSKDKRQTNMHTLHHLHLPY